ncbi:hypothetical protein GCM10025734_78780 [Kitasatospora paranensis]
MVAQENAMLGALDGLQALAPAPLDKQQDAAAPGSRRTTARPNRPRRSRTFPHRRLPRRHRPPQR